MKHKNERALRPTRILIVDDDRRLLSTMDRRLSEIGCHCTVCSNASEAMLHFAMVDFDLVVTDLTMPGIDGLGIVGMIRNQSDIPILVVTGHSHAYGASIDRYPNVTVFRKPCDARTLTARVRSLLPGLIHAGLNRTEDPR